MVLYHLLYNNYFNRIVKTEKSLVDYLKNSSNYIERVGVNFNPQDGIFATTTVNALETDIGDYVLVVNEYNEIVSKWFVIDKNRTANTQWKLSLRRDLIAENYDKIVNSPMYIERATLNQNSPLIFNKEDFKVNQIKQSEHYLKDETGVPWVVGYVPKSYNNTTQIEVKVQNVDADYVFNTQEEFEQWEYYKYTQIKVVGVADERFVFKTQDNQANNTIVTTWDSNGLSSVTTSSESVNGWYVNNTPENLNDFGYDQFPSLNISNLFADTREYLTIYEDVYDKLNNKTIRVGNDFKYINIARSKYAIDYTLTITSNQPKALQTINDNVRLVNGTYDNNAIYHYKRKFEQMKVIDMPSESYFITLSGKDDRYQVTDENFDMFAMPLGSLDVYKNGVKQFTTMANPIPIANAIVNTVSSENVYDLQILPYCPIRYAIKENGQFDIGDNKYDKITKGSTTIFGGIFWATNATNTFNIEYSINPKDYKVSNQCDLYRLCSPNGNGIYEFSPSMNKGVDYFNVDYTYRPINPYIHINPNFKGLYGVDTNDYRGLICGGDFSLTQLNTPWATYQMNNKNYEATWNLQVKSQNVERVLGAVSTGLGGMASGALINPALGAIGGTIGLGASAIGGYADYKIQQRLHEYELDNIKAMPQSISKTSALNANNKYFPYIEYYTCTDEEKKAFKYKLKYEGMTVGIIDVMANYITNEKSFISGDLIRLEGANIDTHELSEIRNILKQGVYI